MFLCKFYEKNGDSNFILKENDEIYGFSINKNGIGELQYELFETIKKDLLMNDRCYKIFEHKGYEVYYDKLTGFKHFIRNGIEDLHLFFENNGEDATLYLENEKKNNVKDSVAKVFKVGSSFLISTVLGFSFVYSTLLISLSGAYYIVNGIDYSHYNHKYQLQEVVDVDEEHVISVIKKHITDSPNLSEEDKKLFINSGLIELVVPYYGDNICEMMFHFKDLKVKYIPKAEDILFKTDIAAGYVSQLKPNVINIAVYDDEDGDHLKDLHENKTLKIHEFVHVLQGNSEYDFLTEGVASIVGREMNFDDWYATCYDNDIFLLEILMDVIGREPILRASFGGDSSMLENILADNLSFDQYDKFLRFLLKRPGKFSSEERQEMYGLIKQLYRNIYGKNIEQDTNIMVDVLYGSKLYPNENIPENTSRKRYFIDHKEKKDSLIVGYVWDDVWMMLFDDGIIIKKEKRKVIIPISFDEYMQLKGKEEVRFNEHRESRGPAVVSLEEENDKCIMDMDGYFKDFSIKEAVEKGYIEPYLVKTLELDEDIPDNCIEHWTVEVFESKDPNVIVENNDKVIINIPCGVDRFNGIYIPDKADRITI